MMKSILFFILCMSPAVFAVKITYHKDKTDFVAEHDGKTFSFASSTLKHVFIINDCNRAMLEKYWRRILKDAEKFPHATSLPDEKRGYVRIDNDYRYIMPIAKNRLARLEQEIVVLRAQVKKRCKNP